MARAKVEPNGQPLEKPTNLSHDDLNLDGGDGEDDTISTKPSDPSPLEKQVREQAAKLEKPAVASIPEVLKPVHGTQKTADDLGWATGLDSPKTSHKDGEESAQAVQAAKS